MNESQSIMLSQRKHTQRFILVITHWTTQHELILLYVIYTSKNMIKDISGKNPIILRLKGKAEVKTLCSFTEIFSLTINLIDSDFSHEK